MISLWLSRVRLRRDASAVSALSRLLVPQDNHARITVAHHLIWTLFADRPDRRRDFLWREEAPGRFMTLSVRMPDAGLGLFDVESRPFEPALSQGDRLAFTLRANPTVSRPDGSGRRGVRRDVVMDALHPIPREERAVHRFSLVQEVGRSWLRRQGEAHGFLPQDNVGVDGYESVRLHRDAASAGAGGRGDICFSRLDLTGLLTITDSHRFLPALVAGFGRARAFGCGLMLIRRA